MIISLVSIAFYYLSLFKNTICMVAFYMSGIKNINTKHDPKAYSFRILLDCGLHRFLFVC